jgi:hypothetical protein
VKREFGDALDGRVGEPREDGAEVVAHRDLEPAAAFTHSLDPLADTDLTISKLASRPPSTVCLLDGYERPPEYSSE